MRAVPGFGNDRVILTFVPASFKYMRLMGKQSRSRSSSLVSSSLKGPQNAVDGAIKEGSCSGDSKTEVQRQSSLLTQGSVEGSF